MPGTTRHSAAGASQRHLNPLMGGLNSLVLLATGFKAHRLLMVYLNLRGAVMSLVILTLALIADGYLITRFA
ncbi:hypothetical protein [Halomonas sp.]|uniref:hypothetical protein n=1 Tax=Halomonas sp. TaxID=1486246 RepID=UPI00298DA1D5|nr:hypothetical protein [Halomonas sp.]MDW7745478.1 hypothetical protein [Halomonas sp.]